MALEGLHHITAITGDAPRNVDFYARTLGLRLVKKTVNFDQPDVYHLYYGDEVGASGSILTFFEFPDAAPGVAGDGMVHTIRWRVASEEALAFWRVRLEGRVLEGETEPGAERVVAFADPEGLRHELVVADVPDPPLRAVAEDVPAEFALLGFDGVRAYARDPERSAALLERLGFTADAAGAWTAAGAERRSTLTYDRAPGRGAPGAGTIHHIAWSVADDAELEQLRGLAGDGGAQPTPIIDRQYFHSVYFREPSGVLFELASRDVGFDVDEPRASLGSALKLPARYEAERERIEPALTPIVNPRQVPGMSASLPVRIREGAGDATLVLLHGRGADEHDLFGLFDVLDPERRLRGVTVGGPLFLPPGGRHWYVVPRVGFPDHDTFTATFAELTRTLDDEVGVDWARTVVGGFSQGTVMSYALGLGTGRPAPAGILALSGFIPTVDGWTPDLAGRPGLPVFVGHGSQDPVISVDFARQARTLLEDGGAAVTYHETPMGHTIDPRLLPEIQRWLAAVA